MVLENIVVGVEVFIVRVRDVDFVDIYIYMVVYSFVEGEVYFIVDINSMIWLFGIYIYLFNLRLFDS